MNTFAQAAHLILSLLQEKAIASDSDHAAAFDLSLWKTSVLSLHKDLNAASTPCENKDALWAKDNSLFYDPEMLAASFLENPKNLEEQFVSLCLDNFFRRYGTSSHKAGSCFSGGGHGGNHGGKSGKETAARQETVFLSRREEIDYRTLLRRFCVPREEAVPDLDSFDYVPYLYGQSYSQECSSALTERPFQSNQSAVGMTGQAFAPKSGKISSDAPATSANMRLCLIEPLEYSEVNRLDELAIAIDTSGSCSGELVQRFLEETWSILRQRENFFSRMRLHLIQCDSMIQEYRIFTSVEEWEETLGDLKIQGYGNTDFRPVFELLDEQIAKKKIRTLRALLYFTDGDGIYPREAPPYETAFIFVNRDSIKGRVPDWAHCIVLETAAQT
ncbi:MAG: VWA-like domain-containing protein [Clostridiales bacterium]|nr:VWA-like domain-containing protein [Clostridiales bacterium]